MADFLQFLQSESKNTLPQMVDARILPSFLASVKKNGHREFSEALLRVWIVEMLVAGAKIGSVKRYVTGLYSLYKAWQKEYQSNDPFKNVLVNLTNGLECPRKRLIENLSCVKRLFRKRLDSLDNQASAIFLVLLYDARLDLTDLIRLKRAAYDIDCPQIEDIIDSVMSKSNGTKYVFQLRRGDYTDKSLERRIVSDIRSLLKSIGMNIDDSFSADYIKSLWITAALKCGVNASSIRNVVKSVPAEYSCLSLLEPNEIDEDDKQRIIRRVANSVNDTTCRWYIMNIRQKETPETVKEAIRAFDKKTLNDILFYNPTYKVIKRDRNGKKRIEEKSYLPGILFFKMRSDKVAGLMSEIKDVAWCYKWSKSPDSSYSYLTQSQMKIFQRHIGLLSPDIRMELEVRDTPLACNTKVVINSGDFTGQVGRITSVRNIDGTRTYSLEITENVAARWTVKDIEEVFLTPA